MMSEYIVSADWLQVNLQNEKLIVLDASLKPITSKEGSAGYEDMVIPKTRKFDLKQAFSDAANPIDHTLPSVSGFVKEMNNLGISDDSIIIIYDNQGVYSSPRAWYMIKSLGHKEVYVLDGGLAAWLEKGFPVVKYENATYVKGDFSDRSDKDYFCNSEYILENLDNPHFLIIDARSENRFHGLEPEPRPNLKLGHIPNSINLPFHKVLNNGKYKSFEELCRLFLDLKSKDTTLIFSCGSGVTACITALAAQMAGYTKTIIYDGSWSEWGHESSTYPISK